MDRTEPPTSSHIEELREQGIVPYSSFAARCASALIVIFSVLALKDHFKVLLGSFQSIASVRDLNMIIGEGVQNGLSHELLVLLLVPAIAAITGALLAGLFQTRFVFRLSQISPNMSRLNPFAIRGILNILKECGFRFLLVFLSGVFATFLFRIMVTDILMLINKDPGEVIYSMWKLFEATLPIFILVIAFSGFLSWLLARNSFFQAHRMTREEVLKENEDNQ
ncbi:MAG: EscU/YscU/HrcU family type III secretion system export apparatus switch protein [SAR324 cluster bacterium]|uniref:EscU/YscU/HrcU family type III secretion system export apparatus switch protein n=1 Tax=SAR324 cluster bacterium TaxID=2024889 RepID=A0A7X9IIK3_9DELT|nr:EscU/YscU/HrcU family type III secretion system export apparatus switch protein [SAR324 cluster bacterium]